MNVQKILTSNVFKHVVRGQRSDQPGIQYKGINFNSFAVPQGIMHKTKAVENSEGYLVGIYQITSTIDHCKYFLQFTRRLFCSQLR